jgi:signal transduction histidine kinase
MLEQSIRDNATALEKMVDDRTAALRRVSGRLLTMQDDERRRIARELHDGLGQELVAAKMMIGGILAKGSVQSHERSAQEASDTIDRAIQQVRSLSHLLHPPLLDEVGLLSALRWYLDGLTKRSGIETSLEVEPPEFLRLSSELETAIFRITQEALTNVYRHSEARKAAVTLSQQNGHILVTIRDHGKGVENAIAELRPGSVGIGMGGMSQRAREFGGELRISNANPGTLVEVTIPYATHRPHAMNEPAKLSSSNRS